MRLASAVGVFNIARQKLSGETGTAAWTFGLTAILKLGSSIILTRLLSPEDYGVITMVISILVLLEMLSDLGFSLFILRHPDPQSPRVINTVWTVRLVRSVLNAGLLWITAPAIASLFNAAGQVNLIRIASITVLLQGLESLGYILAMRQQRSSLAARHELIASAVSSALSILWIQHVERSALGMVLSMISYRALMCAFSHTQVPYHVRPRLCWDSETLHAIWSLAKRVIPSSLCTVGLQQLDRILIAKLLPLAQLGIYGIGQNMAGMADGMAGRLIGTVVTPRLASLVKQYPPQQATESGHDLNLKPIRLSLGLPILLGCFAPLAVGILYDGRYASTALVVQAVCLRSVLVHYTSLGSQILALAGYNQVLGVPSLLRTIVIGLGAYPLVNFAGFQGLLLLVAIEPLVGLLYVKRLQYSVGFFSVRIEREIFLFCALTFTISLSLAQALQWILAG